MKISLNPETKRNCKYCNKEFHPTTPGQQFDTVICKKAYTKKHRHDKYIWSKNKEKNISDKANCLFCNKEFTKNSEPQKFCCVRCRKLYNTLHNSCESNSCVKDFTNTNENKNPLHTTRESNENVKNYDNVENACYQLRRDIFLIKIIENNGTYLWKAFNTKTKQKVLQSSNSFDNFTKAVRDAQSAF